MKRICDNCGLEAEEYWMFPFNTGRSAKWFCWDCYKNAQREATKSDLARQKKLYQIHNGKKRNR